MVRMPIGYAIYTLLYDEVNSKIMDLKTLYVIDAESGMTLAYIDAKTEKKALELLKRDYDDKTTYIELA